MNIIVDPSPGDEAGIGSRHDQVSWFWEQLYAGNDPGETTWEELDSLHDQVTKALACVPADVSQAETLTAYAMWLMSGMSIA